jgi:hypothetical protein
VLELVAAAVKQREAAVPLADAGDNMHDVPLSLDAALHRDHARGENDAALPLIERRVFDHDPRGCLSFKWMACELRSVAIPDVQAQGLILSDTDAASYRARPRARARLASVANSI